MPETRECCSIVHFGHHQSRCPGFVGAQTHAHTGRLLGRSDTWERYSICVLGVCSSADERQSFLHGMIAARVTLTCYLQAVTSVLWVCSSADQRRSFLHGMVPARVALTCSQCAWSVQQCTVMHCDMRCLQAGPHPWPAQACDTSCQQLLL